MICLRFIEIIPEREAVGTHHRLVLRRGDFVGPTVIVRRDDGLALATTNGIIACVLNNHDGWMVTEAAKDLFTRSLSTHDRSPLSSHDSPRPTFLC